MARAYIVHARNDLSVVAATGVHPGLQITDLVPNTSLKNGALAGPGQTGYSPWYMTNDTVVLNGAGPIVTVGVDYGLQAYFVDRVQNRTGGAGDLALTAAELVAIVNVILARVAAGSTLTLADINTAINTPATVTGSNLDGDGASTSTGTVEQVLRILAGEMYRVPDGAQVADAAPNFDATVRGAFVTRPNVELPESIRTTNLAGTVMPVRGKSSFNSPVIPTTAATQTGTQDTNFRDIRQLVDTGDLHLSVLNGTLDKLNDATFEWDNDLFTYGAGGTATTIAGVAIPATFIGRAVVVYDVAGNVI